MNTRFLPRPLHSDGHQILPPSRWVQAVVALQHPEEPQRVALYPAPHPALLSLQLHSELLKTCQPPSLLQKPARSLQIHSGRELLKRFRDKGSGNCSRRQCLHLKRLSLAVAASIDLVTQTWPVLCLQRADSWSSKMWNRRPFLSANDLETVSYATRSVSKALTEGPHWQIIETYWNTAMQQNNIWSIAFEARTKEILKEVC
jgi:hypothetical protein